MYMMDISKVISMNFLGVIMKSLLILISLLLIQNLLAQSKFIRDDEVVLDTELKLIWQDNLATSNTKLGLEEAIKYCDNLNLYKNKNWRLPTYEELLSIGDYEVYKPTINEVFKNSASGHFWSIMYKQVAFGEEWTAIKDHYVQRIYFSDGYSYDNDRTGKAYVRCVKNFKP